MYRNSHKIAVIAAAFKPGHKVNNGKSLNSSRGDSRGRLQEVPTVTLWRQSSESFRWVVAIRSGRTWRFNCSIEKWPDI